MKKFLYMFLVLPTLSSQAEVKKSKRHLHLKAATFLKANQKDQKNFFKKGRCYIFDEKEPALILEDVHYEVDKNNELIVDLKLKEKDQNSLEDLTRRLSNKRHLVLSVNDKVVSTSQNLGILNRNIDLKKKLKSVLSS